MSLATASTHVEAVRQHGGGLAHHLPTTTGSAGRLARSNGGEMNSRCAAASLIAPASRPCGAHAYPLTGVRRAAHPAAPLRSTPRPTAQLVEGYAHQQASQISDAGQPPLRRPSTRSKVQGVLRMSLLANHCDICNRPRSRGTHTTCSRQRQALHRSKWEVLQ